MVVCSYPELDDNQRCGRASYEDHCNRDHDRGSGPVFAGRIGRHGWRCVLDADPPGSRHLCARRRGLSGPVRGTDLCGQLGGRVLRHHHRHRRRGGADARGIGHQRQLTTDEQRLATSFGWSRASLHCTRVILCTDVPLSFWMGVFFLKQFFYIGVFDDEGSIEFKRFVSLLGVALIDGKGYLVSGVFYFFYNFFVV